MDFAGVVCVLLFFGGLAFLIFCEPIQARSDKRSFDRAGPREKRRLLEYKLIEKRYSADQDASEIAEIEEALNTLQ